MRPAIYTSGAVCAFLSVITTLGIHAYFKGPATFEESLKLYKTTYYLVGKWWVIFHCIFVIISVYSLSVYLTERRKRAALLGFVFYTAFGLTEIFRMLMVLHYMSHLRDQYLVADGIVRDMIKVSLDSVFGISEMLFTAFTIFILLGNLFLGMACLENGRIFRAMGILFLLWSIVLTISLMNVYLHQAILDELIKYFSLIVQPFIRGFLGFALLRISRTH